MTQNNEAFEKWFKTFVNELKDTRTRNDYVGNMLKMELSWQASKAESDKEIAELQAHINQLREALLSTSKYVDHFDPSSTICKIISEALASTPSQSLQAHDVNLEQECLDRGITEYCQRSGILIFKPHSVKEVLNEIASLYENQSADAIRNLKGNHENNN